METFGNEIKQKISNKYCCTICDYYTERKSNIDKHITSAKHMKEINGNEIKQKLSNILCCEKCNKVYQTKAGLWKHNKKCNNLLHTCVDETNKIIDDSIDKNQLIIMLIKQNSELIKETTEFKI